MPDISCLVFCICSDAPPPRPSVDAYEMSVDYGNGRELPTACLIVVVYLNSQQCSDIEDKNDLLTCLDSECYTIASWGFQNYKLRFLNAITLDPYL